MRKILTLTAAAALGFVSPAIASQYVRHATASQEIVVGPFLDTGDFVTPKEELSIANTDVRLRKAGASASVAKNSGGCTHDEDGSYLCTLDETDTDTLGSMRVTVIVDGAAPVWEDVHVLSASAYDALFGAAPYATAADLADAVEDLQEGIAVDEEGIAAAVWSALLEEPTAAPTWSSSTGEWLAWMAAWTRNKTTATASQKCVRNDADNANISCQSLSDTGGTFTVGEAP